MVLRRRRCWWFRVRRLTGQRLIISAWCFYLGWMIWSQCSRGWIGFSSIMKHNELNWTIPTLRIFDDRNRQTLKWTVQVRRSQIVGCAAAGCAPERPGRPSPAPAFRCARYARTPYDYQFDRDVLVEGRRSASLCRHSRPSVSGGKGLPPYICWSFTRQMSGDYFCRPPMVDGTLDLSALGEGSVSL